MFIIYNMSKAAADRQYRKCDRCEGKIPCPESNCLWAGVLADGGEGKTYCTAPEGEKESQITRFGM